MGSPNKRGGLVMAASAGLAAVALAACSAGGARTAPPTSEQQANAAVNSYAASLTGKLLARLGMSDHGIVSSRNDAGFTKTYISGASTAQIQGYYDSVKGFLRVNEATSDSGGVISNSFDFALSESSMSSLAQAETRHSMTASDLSGVLSTATLVSMDILPLKTENEFKIAAADSGPSDYVMSEPNNMTLAPDGQLPSPVPLTAPDNLSYAEALANANQTQLDAVINNANAA